MIYSPPPSGSSATFLLWSSLSVAVSSGHPLHCILMSMHIWCPGLWSVHFHAVVVALGILKQVLMCIPLLSMSLLAFVALYLCCCPHLYLLQLQFLSSNQQVKVGFHVSSRHLLRHIEVTFWFWCLYRYDISGSTSLGRAKATWFCVS